ncbi:MAG: M16 family metallopeptidase [bacterium]
MYHKTTLPSGLRLITEEIPTVSSVAVGLWVNVGSKWEAVSEAGISHLIEHLLFKGTHRRTAREIAELLDSVGGQLNAFTSKEHTCYYARVLAQHFELAIDVLVDMFLNAKMLDEDVEREKRVVQEEINMYEDSPDELIHDLLSQAVWTNHSLGRPVLGTRESVANLTLDQIHSFWRRFYTPNNLVIAVAGNIEHQRVVTVCDKLFSTITPSRFSSLDIEPPQFQPGLKLYPRDLEQVHLCLGAPGVPNTDENTYVVDVANSILGGGLSSRLFQHIREDQGLAYSIYSYHTAYKDSGLFTVYAGLSKDNYNQGLDLARQELEIMMNEPVPNKELDRAKQQVLGGFFLGLENTTNRMIRLARHELILNRWVSPEEVQEKIMSVTSSNIQSLCSRLFGQADLATVLLGPVEEETAC